MIGKIPILSSLVFAVAVAAAPMPVAAVHDDDYCRRCGTVRSVQQIAYRDRHVGGGTVLGALIGGAVGNRIGDGDRRATVGGAIVGGAIGNRVESRNRGYDVYYRISVRSDRGRIFTVDQRRSYGLHPGDRVEFDDGQVRPRYRYGGY